MYKLTLSNNGGESVITKGGFMMKIDDLQLEQNIISTLIIQGLSLMSTVITNILLDNPYILQSIVFILLGIAAIRYIKKKIIK